MDTQLVQHNLANAEIGAPSNIMNFTTDYKTKRNEILTTDYNIKKTNTFTSSGTYNFIVSTAQDVTINVDAIKNKLNELKKQTTSKIEDEIKIKIKNIITDLRAHVKTLTVNTVDIKNKLAEIYAINSSIKVFTILYMYVVLLDKYATSGSDDGGDDKNEIAVCTPFFGEAACKANPFLNFTYADLQKKDKMLVLINSKDSANDTMFTYLDQTKKSEIIKAFNDQYTSLKTAAATIEIGKLLLTGSDFNDTGEAVVALLRDSQYNRALYDKKSGGDGKRDDSLLKFVVDSLPVLSGFSVEDLNIKG